MFAMQYSHRLPAEQPMELIEQRASQRGAVWDKVTGLIFKAFVAQRKGRYNADGNLYSSVYLWSDLAPAIDFVSGGGIKTVIETFGRPAIEQWLPLDARKGKARTAASLYREDALVRPGTDLFTLKREAAKRDADIADSEDTLAVWFGLNPSSWTTTRFVLRAGAPRGDDTAVAYEVFHLSKPGLGELP